MMITWAIQDYFEAFRWRYVKEKYKKGMLWTLIYFLGVIPLVMGVFEEDGNPIAFLSVMVPFYFCIAAEPLHSEILPKMMYLCPMSREMRKKYIIYACYVRIAVPMLVGVLGVMVLLLSRICDWLCGIGVLLNISALSICLGACIYINGPGKFTQSGTISPNAGLLEIFIIIVTMLIGLGYATGIQGMMSVQWIKWSVLVLEIVLLVPMVISYLKKGRGATEQAMIYERSCILAKEEQRTGR